MLSVVLLMQNKTSMAAKSAIIDRAPCQSLQEAKLSLGQLTALPHSTFGGQVTSSVT